MGKKAFSWSASASSRSVRPGPKKVNFGGRGENGPGEGRRGKKPEIKYRNCRAFQTPKTWMQKYGK